MTCLILALLTIPKSDEDHQLAVSHPYKTNCSTSAVMMKVGVCLRVILVRGMRGGGSVMSDWGKADRCHCRGVICYITFV